MHRSAAELTFDALNKCQTPDRNCLRPVIVSHCPPVLNCLFDPLAVCSLKISQIRKSAQLAQAL